MDGGIRREDEGDGEKPTSNQNWPTTNQNSSTMARHLPTMVPSREDPSRRESRPANNGNKANCCLRKPCIWVNARTVFVVAPSSSEPHSIHDHPLKLSRLAVRSYFFLEFEPPRSCPRTVTPKGRNGEPLNRWRGSRIIGSTVMRNPLSYDDPPPGTGTPKAKVDERDTKLSVAPGPSAAAVLA